MITFTFSPFHLFTFPRCGEEATGSEDILTTTGTDGGKHTVSRQIVALGFHAFLVGAGQVDTWDLVETDEVHTAIQSL